MRIHALCANPAVDVSMETGHVYAHRKIRSDEQRIEPGGGDINVARALAELGLPTRLLYLAGGVSGRLPEAELLRSGLDGTRVAIAGDTRIAFNVHERASGAEYRFVPDGPRVDAAETRAWNEALAAPPLAAEDIVVASGSLPRGLPADTFAHLAERVGSHDARFVLDTSEAALAAALEPGAATPPFLIKPSLGELESLSGERLAEGGAERAALALVEAGRALNVAVSMGPYGALLANAAGTVRLPSPHVRAHSAVGAGDSFLGAMLWRIALGDAIVDAFDHGVAAGAAAVMTGRTELCRRRDVLRLHAALGPPVPGALP